MKMNRTVRALVLVSIVVLTFTVGSVAVASTGLFDRFCSFKNLGTGTIAMLCNLNKRLSDVESQLPTLATSDNLSSLSSQVQNQQQSLSTLTAQSASQASQLSAQQSTLTSLVSQAGPILVDGNNNYLGPLVTPSNLAIFGSISFYSKSLNLLVPVDNQGILARGYYLIGYTGANCTGSPFLWEGNKGETLSLLDEMTLVRIASQYFVPSGDIGMHTYLSQFNSNNTCTPNTAAGQQEGIALTPLASIRYSNPVAMPIHLMSQ